MGQLIIDARFNGPPGTANGGYLAGLLAGPVSGPVEVTLRAPVPLGRALPVEARSDGSREIVAGGDLLARARPATLELDVPAPPTLEEAIAAAGRARFSGAEHPFPDCFVCGPDRLPADGFRLVPGPLGRDNASAVDWWPYPALAGADGYVRPEFVWAALDCPGGLATAEATGDATPMVLGRITAALERPVPAEEPYVVIGWFIGAEGRKRQAGTAIFGADGTRYGLALATWFQVATAALQQAA